MKDRNATILLKEVMGWRDTDAILDHVPLLQLLASYKYDSYQRFAPGKQFIESLALWLNQFDPNDRPVALQFVVNRLIYISDIEVSHLVRSAYPDLIVQERIRLVAEEQGIATHRVGEITRHARFNELRLKSLYLGLSDGARTNELRRASNSEIGNEQIWQAYELGDEKAAEMLGELRAALASANITATNPKFTLVWLLDDFSGSGNTYIRFDSKTQKYKGKIKKVYDRLHQGDLIDPAHYEVFLLLFVATRQAIDHIEYWSERFTSERGYKPLQLKVFFPIESDVAINAHRDPELVALLKKADYYDDRASDKHISVGGTVDAKLGFAKCALPIVLSHNTPNNSIYILWGPESYKFSGLFPRASRHREF